MKKVSLILTTYNCKKNLLKTIESIEKQDYPNIEVVIKDGESVDGTLDVIKKYQRESNHQVIWESKKDNGIYDAMNQGYLLSSGDVIVFFNDLFVGNNCISKMIKKMEEINPKTGKEYVGIHADLVYAEGEKVIREWKMGQGTIYQGWMPGHPTLFLKREIYEKYGLYDDSYRIAADYEFMVRFLKDEKNKLAYLPETMISMFYGGTSSGGLKSYSISLIESYRALVKNKVPFAWWLIFRRGVRVLKQFRN